MEKDFTILKGASDPFENGAAQILIDTSEPFEGNTNTYTKIKGRSIKDIS